MRLLCAIAPLAVVSVLTAPHSASASEFQVPSRATPDLATAVAHAVSGDTIVVSPLYRPTSTPVFISASIQIEGMGEAASVPPLVVSGGAQLAVSQLRFSAMATDGSAVCQGLCIEQASVTAVDVLFDGVGATVDSGSLVLVGAIFDGAPIGVDAIRATLDLNDVVFSRSRTTGLRVNRCTSAVVDVEFRDSRGLLPGVDILASGGTLELTQGRFSGGAIARLCSTTRLQSCKMW